MAAETGFLIDGTVYEVPTLDSLTMGERRVMFDLSGAIQEDFFRDDDETAEEHDERTGKMMRHAGFWQALMHIAYQRGNPGLKAARVALVIDQTNLLDAMTHLGDEDDEDEGDDAGPLALTPPPDKPSPRKPSSKRASTKRSRESGGSDSTTDSDEPAADPIPIGTGRSATSSPALPPKESVA